MKYLLVWGFIGLANPAFAGPQLFKMSLAEAEKKALETSLEMKEAEARIGMASAGVQAQKSALTPRLSLDGSYRYVTEVPKVDQGPMQLQLGQHHNASIGPTLSYELYDGGVDASASASAQSLMQAETKERAGTGLRLILDTRMAYVQVQTGIEELHLVNESLRLVQARMKDAQRRLQAGSASRLELLAAQREELQLNLRFSQAQTNLAESLRHLATLVGFQSFPDPLLPVGHTLKIVAKGPSPNVRIDLDNMNLSLQRVRIGVAGEPNVQHPSLQALDERQTAARLLAESRESESRPKIQAFAKTSYEYPNGPVDEAVWQNAVGVSVSLTLYDGGLRQGLAAQKTAEAQMNAMKKAQIERNFRESWSNARSRLDQMHTQAQILRDSIQRSQEESDLTTVNYQAGSANYLEVQRAHNQVLETKTALLRLEGQMLSQWATLNYLSAPKEVQP